MERISSLHSQMLFIHMGLDDKPVSPKLAEAQPYGISHL